VQKRTTRGYSLSFISFEDVHDGFAALDMNAAGAERSAEAMLMLVSRRSSPAPAGRSEILRCRGDLATRNHHERGTAWAHPSIRDTGPDGRRLRIKLRTQHERMFSGLPSNSDIARCSRHVSRAPILLQKSFCVTEYKFSGPYTRRSNNNLRDYIIYDELTGDFGNGLEAASIGDCGPFGLFTRN
jgi:hypothetical protein